MKHGVFGIPETWLLAKHAYNTSKTASESLVGSLLGGTDLNYVEHKYFIRRLSVYGWKHREYLETEVLTRSKDMANGVGLNRLRKATENGAWLMAIPQRLNVTES